MLDGLHPYDNPNTQFAIVGIPEWIGGPGAARTTAANLAEQFTMEEAKAGAGREIMQDAIRDVRRPSEFWAKMSHTHVTFENVTIEIHYWRNRITGVLEEFKFKNPL